MKRNPWKKLLSKVKLCGSEQASRSRVKEVTITEEDLQTQFYHQEGKCYWLGLPLNIDDVYTSNNPFGPSVDRLDNDKDYHKDNIVICCSFVNMGRGSVDKKLFALFINYLKHYIKNYD
jgi:hypothetical protein